MAFQDRLLSTIPTRPADVEIIFHGQLLLRSTDGRSCDVAINPIAANHFLTIEARTKIAGQPDVINMRQVGQLNFRSPEGMTIEVNPPADTLASWKCVSATAINPESGAVGPSGGGGPQAEDFRWVMNLEGGLFHNANLRCSVFENRQHVIRLQQGEFFFRSGNRARPGLRYERRQNGQNPANFRGLGAIARVSAFLGQTQTVIMRWNDATGPQVLTLEKPPQGGIHEIYVENTPLFIDPATALGHDELAEYYKVLPDVAQNAKFTFRSFQEPQPGPGFDAGTPTIPCQVVRLDEPPN